MARFSVLIFALALLLSSADGWAKGKNGSYNLYGNESCGYYLDAYSRSTLTGRGTQNGPHDAWSVFGWIAGYLSAYNELTNNGKKSILGSMTSNDARRWIAAWCRDSPSKKVWDAVDALIGKLNR